MLSLETLVYLLAGFVALWGVSGQTGLRSRAFRPILLSYYTTQSNLLTALFHLLAAFAPLLGWERLQTFLSKPVVHLSAMLCIMLTFLVFHFMLWPLMKKDPGDGFNRVDNFCVHYLCPWLTLLGWLLFADKQGLTLTDAGLWLALPLAYLLFVVLRAPTGQPFHPDGTRYPYPFLDFDKLGARRALLNCGALLVAAYGMGCAFVLLGRWIK